MYKALFFDVDDTLLNFKQCSEAALSKAFDSMNLSYNHSVSELFYQIDDELWSKQKQGLLSVQEVIDCRFSILLTQMKINADTNKLKLIFQENLSKESIPEPGACDIIRDLSSNFKLYVASNGFLKMQQSRLRLVNLLPYFSDIFVSDDIGYEKPDSYFFDECLKRSGLKNDEILFIGDSIDADISGAYHSGIATCWYNPNNKINHSNFKIDYTIRHLCQLKDLVNLEP